MTTTDRDIRDQVQQAVDASEGTYDVDAIVREIVQRHGLVSIDHIDHIEFWAIVTSSPMPTCAFPGDQEHDHEMCRDAVVDAATTTVTVPTTASEWADALDAEVGNHETVGTMVSVAYADGSICGISIDGDADDDYGCRLTSADGLMVVRYSEQDGYWTAVDADTPED